MPKAILVFDMDDPHEQEHFKYANTGLDVRLAVWQFDEWLRREIKYADPYEPEDSAMTAGLERARSMLYEKFEEYGVDWGVE